MPKLKIDLHVHTNHSDSTSSIEKVLESAKKKNLDGIAITDHDAVTASNYASEFDAGLILIPGVEVETGEGHILVLGIKRPPPKNLNVAEIIDFARKEGGVTIIPHPGIPFISINEKIIKLVKPDAIETHNAKAPFFRYFVKRNTKLAERLGLPKTGGSDAHSHKSVGDAYTIVDADSRSVAAILDAIKRGRTQPVGEASNLIENMKTTTRIFMRKHIFKKFSIQR